MGTQWIPDVPYAKFAELLGFKGIYCDDESQVGAAWDEAFASNKPVVLDFKVDQEIPPVPPHIMTEQAKKAATAMVKGDPEAAGLIRKGVKQKAHEFTESVKTHLPGGSDR
jgi:pyruvate dehydrogenase (quinone)